MRKFVVKILIFAGVVLCATTLLWRCMITVENNYSIRSHETNVRRQIERLDTLQSPKIIFIGGSGCGFGISSPMIRDHSHMNVCNTGTHAGLGLRLQVELYRKCISKGDIVVIIPEYEQYTGLFLGDETVFRIFTSTYKPGYKHISVRQQFHLFPYVAKAFHDDAIMKGLKEVDATSPYSIASLNEYGDVENYAYRNHREAAWKPNALEGDVDKTVIPYLKGLYQECIEKQATMLIFPPAFRQGAFEFNEGKIEEIWNMLEQSDLPVVSNPRACMLPDSLYYDTDYHLTYEGVVIRTNKLIADLDALL